VSNEQAGNKSAPKKQANAQAQYTVSTADLPLSCPMPDMKQWNSHPKVYLPIEYTGTTECPYCGAVFVLNDGAVSEPSI